MVASPLCHLEVEPLHCGWCRDGKPRRRQHRVQAACGPELSRLHPRPCRHGGFSVGFPCPVWQLWLCKQQLFMSWLPPAKAKNFKILPP